MEEKTEKPSVRKLKKAREKGDVAQSPELTSGLILLGALLLLWALSSLFERGFKETFRLSLMSTELSFRPFVPLLYPTLLMLAGIFVIALFSHLFQTGWVWSWPKSKKKGERRLWVYFVEAGDHCSYCLLYNFPFPHTSHDPSRCFKKSIFSRP